MKRDDAISRMQTFNAICDRIETTDLRKYPLLEHKSKMFDIVKSVIEQAPGVDAAPVVHGRWENQGFNPVRCSICGVTPNALRGTTVQPDFKFCPYCGALMDGGEDDAAD